MLAKDLRPAHPHPASGTRHAFCTRNPTQRGDTSINTYLWSRVASQADNTTAVVHRHFIGCCSTKALLTPQLERPPTVETARFRSNDQTYLGGTETAMVCTRLRSFYPMTREHLPSLLAVLAASRTNLIRAPLLVEGARRIPNHAKSRTRTPVDTIRIRRRPSPAPHP
jgi:hypothetical protein